MPLLKILSFDIIPEITVKTDITAMTAETAKTLVSSNVYPKQALTNAPTGKSSVNANSKHSKTKITFLIKTPQFLPIITAYLFDKILDIRQNTGVSKKNDSAKRNNTLHQNVRKRYNNYNIFFDV